MCSQVIDWLKEDGTLGATELQMWLKDAHKIMVPYKRVYKGKNLAMNKIYEPFGAKVLITYIGLRPS